MKAWNIVQIHVNFKCFWFFYHSIIFSDCSLLHTSTAAASALLHSLYIFLYTPVCRCLQISVQPLEAQSIQPLEAQSVQPLEAQYQTFWEYRFRAFPLGTKSLVIALLALTRFNHADNRLATSLTGDCFGLSVCSHKPTAIYIKLFDVFPVFNYSVQCWRHNS